MAVAVYNLGHEEFKRGDNRNNGKGNLMMNLPKKWKPRRLPPLEAGKVYEGWIGLVSDQPFSFQDPDYYNGVPHVDLFPTKRAARACYQAVRRVRIIIEDER